VFRPQQPKVQFFVAYTLYVKAFCTMDKQMVGVQVGPEALHHRTETRRGDDREDQAAAPGNFPDIVGCRYFRGKADPVEPVGAIDLLHNCRIAAVQEHGGVYRQQVRDGSPEGTRSNYRNGLRPMISVHIWLV
jgi:hypothetical protein